MPSAAESAIESAIRDLIRNDVCHAFTCSATSVSGRRQRIGGGRRRARRQPMPLRWQRTCLRYPARRRLDQHAASMQRQAADIHRLR
jgi:hypothetical protein